MKIGGGKINLIIGIVVAVLAIAGLAVGLYIHFTKGPPDNGLMVREGTDGEVTLRPKELPLTVFGRDGITAEEIVWASEWWNKRAGRKLFRSGGVDYFYDVAYDGGKAGKTRHVFVSVGAAESKCGGIARPIFDKANGEIWYTEITINHEHAYHKSTRKATLLHEMGHALGLEDDPHSLDRGGIMDEKAATVGISDPTPHDLEVIGGL